MFGFCFRGRILKGRSVDIERIKRELTAARHQRCAPSSSIPRIETRANGKPVIVGVAAVFYKPSDPGSEYWLYPDMVERIKPGAFDRAVKEDDVRALVNHLPSLILGRNKAKTLRLFVDSVGLRYEIGPPDTQAARDVLESLKRGDVDGSSFSFRDKKVVYSKETRVNGDVIYVRELHDVILFDVGPVAFPAYPSASSGVGGGSGSDRHSARARVAEIERQERAERLRSMQERAKQV